MWTNVRAVFHELLWPHARAVETGREARRAITFVNTADAAIARILDAEAAVAAGCSVTLVANGVGNSPHIHALNCPVLEGDSAARMRDDTLSSGHGTNDASLVQVLCEGAVALKDEFAFDRNDDGSYKTIQPLGSSIPRCVSIDHAIGANLFCTTNKS